jgi:hypothetical protein
LAQKSKFFPHARIIFFFASAILRMNRRPWLKLAASTYVWKANVVWIRQTRASLLVQTAQPVSPSGSVGWMSQEQTTIFEINEATHPDDFHRLLAHLEHQSD